MNSSLSLSLHYVKLFTSSQPAKPLDLSTNVLYNLATQCFLFLAVNLILCYYALGDREKMKKTFQKMLQIELDIDDEEKYSSNGVGCWSELRTVSLFSTDIVSVVI